MSHYDDGLPVADSWNTRLLHWTGDPACAPQPSQYNGDAGIDLVVAQNTTIHVGTFKDVPLGIRIQLPPNVWALLIGRSSTLRNRGLLVTQGVIDNGYRGELFAAVQNLSAHKVELQRGERIAQLLPFNLIAPTLTIRHTQELDPSDRGMRDFGSTGGVAQV